MSEVNKLQARSNAFLTDAAEKHGPGPPAGNQNARKHGVYSQWTAEDIAEREQYEKDLIDDLGGSVSTAQRSLIRRGSWLEVRLRRNERASIRGYRGIASEHVLAWINSQRLILCALGLQRKAQQPMSLAEYLEAKSREKEQAENKEASQ